MEINRLTLWHLRMEACDRMRRIASNAMFQDRCGQNVANITKVDLFLRPENYIHQQWMISSSLGTEGETNGLGEGWGRQRLSHIFQINLFGSLPSLEEYKQR